MRRCPPFRSPSSMNFATTTRFVILPALLSLGVWAGGGGCSAPGGNNSGFVNPPTNGSSSSSGSSGASGSSGVNGSGGSSGSTGESGDDAGVMDATVQGDAPSGSSCPVLQTSQTTFVSMAAPGLAEGVAFDRSENDPVPGDAGAGPAGWNFYNFPGAMCRDGSPVGI